MTDFYSRNDVNYNGDVYSIPFPYIKEKEIQVFLDDTLFEDWFFLNDSQIKLRNIPQEVTSKTIVSVRRITNIDKKVVTYTNNTLLNRENLNLSQDQLLFAVQEIYDNNIQFQSDIREEVDEKVERVSDAVEKLEFLEDSVEIANEAALEATEQAQIATEKAEETLQTYETAMNKLETTINDIEFVADGEKKEIEDLADLIKENAKEIANRTSFAMFDTILKDHVLTYEESKGLALQGTYVYKDAIAGSRYGYPDFYNKCLEEYNESTVADKIYLKSNVTIQGTLADTQGILMGFGATSYAKLPSVFNPGTNSWEFVTKIKTPNAYGVRNLSIIGSGITTGADYQGFTVAINTAGKTRTYISSNGTSWNIAKEAIGVDILATGTEYYIKLEFTGTSYIVSISTDGVAWSVQNTITSSAPIYTSVQPLILGGNFYSSANAEYYAVAEGNIDLNYSYIKINDDIWWEGVDSFEYKQHSNGHRFYDITDKQYFDDIFQNNGTAWFYGVDTENERIFLPRNNYFDQVTKELSEVGEYVKAGLPNITGSTGMYLSGDTPSGAFATDSANCRGANSIATNVGVGFDASRCSSIYGNSNTVQPNAVKKLLYICVGNTESESTITDVVDVTTTENDTTPIFTGMYFDFKPNNVSWLIGGGQASNAGIYAFTYNELVNVLNGETKYGNLKVINEADMIVGVDYSEYWKVNQDEMYFITPTAISNKALSGAVVGNGMALGLTTGAQNVGLVTSTNSEKNPLVSTSVYGLPFGSVGSIVAGTSDHISYGVTTDTTKSGIIAEQSTAQLYFKVANAVQNLELLDAGEVLEAVNSIIPNNSSLIANYSVPVTTEAVNLTWNTIHQLPCDAVIIWGGYSASTSDDVVVRYSYDNVTWNSYAVFDSGYIYTTGYALQKGVYIKGTGGNSYQSLGYMPLKGAI